MGIATLLWLTLGNLACSEDAELLSQFEAQVATACMEIPEDRLARLRAVMSAESGTVRGRLVRAMRSWCRENDIPLDPAHQKCISALSKLGIAQNEERLEAERAKREKDRLKKRITREIRATCRSYDAELDDDGILEFLQTIGEQRSKGKSFERAFDVLSALCLMKDLGNAEGDTLEERVEDLDSKLATRRLACRQCYEMLLEVVYGPPGPSEKDMIYFARGIIRAALGLSPVGTHFPLWDDPSYHTGSLGDNRHQVSGMVKAENALGVKTWHKWTVIMRLEDPDLVRAIYLEIDGDVVLDAR